MSTPMSAAQNPMARSLPRSSAAPSAAATATQRKQRRLHEEEHGDGVAGGIVGAEKKSGAAHEAPMMAARHDAQLVIERVAFGRQEQLSQRGVSVADAAGLHRKAADPIAGQREDDADQQQGAGMAAVFRPE